MTTAPLHEGCSAVGRGVVPEVERWITKAAKVIGIELTYASFVWYASEGWTLDGMDPDDWIRAQSDG